MFTPSNVFLLSVALCILVFGRILPSALYPLEKALCKYGLLLLVSACEISCMPSCTTGQRSGFRSYTITTGKKGLFRAMFSQYMSLLTWGKEVYSTVGACLCRGRAVKSTDLKLCCFSRVWVRIPVVTLVSMSKTLDPVFWPLGVNGYR